MTIPYAASLRPPPLAGLTRLARCLFSMAAAGLAAAGRSRGRAEERFAALVLPHLDAAYNLARYLTRSADAADDVVQDAFLRAFRGFAGYRGGAPRAWLLAIVRNCCRDYALERGRLRLAETPKDAVGDDEPGQPLWSSPSDNAEEQLIRRSEAEAVRRTIEELPLPLREVLVLREFEDLSYAELAEAIGAPVGTVMSRLARARERFAAAWRRRLERVEVTL